MTSRDLPAGGEVKNSEKNKMSKEKNLAQSPENLISLFLNTQARPAHTSCTPARFLGCQIAHGDISGAGVSQRARSHTQTSGGGRGHSVCQLSCRDLFSCL